MFWYFCFIFLFTMEKLVPLHILAKADFFYWFDIWMYEQKKAAEGR